MKKVALALVFAILLLIGLPLRVEAQVNNPSAVEQANINLAIHNFQSLVHDLQTQHGYPKALFDRYNATLANLQYMNGANKIKSVPGLQAGSAGYNENGGPPETPAAAYCPPGGYTQVGGVACPDDTIIVDPSFLDPNNGSTLNESNPIDWGKKWNLTSVLIHEKQHEMYVKEALDTLHAQAWWNAITNKDQRNKNTIANALSTTNHGQVYQIQKQNLKDLLKSLDNQIRHSTSATEKRDLNTKKAEITKFLGLLKKNEQRMFGGGGLAKFQECGWPNNFHNGYVALFMTSPSIWERLDMQVQDDSIVSQQITQTRWQGESDLFSPLNDSPSLFITASEQTLFDLSVIDDSCDYYGMLMKNGGISYSTSIPLIFAIEIPNWIKTDAEMWSNGSISDKDFATAIGWLIQHKIISVNVPTNSDGTISVNDNIKIPKWIKDDAFWWSQGTIEDSDFMSAIEYLIDQKIISFSGSEPSILSQIESQNTVKTNPPAQVVTPDENPSPGLAPPGLMPNGQPLTTPPQTKLSFNIPSKIIQEATSSSGAIVDFVAATSPPSTTMICDHNAGTQFSLGNTVVTCTGTGPAGSITKSFTVTVQDTTPPAISPFNPHNDTPDDSGAVVYFTMEAIDLVDGPITPHCDHTSGSKFTFGTTIVTCTADDSHGNHSERKLGITISKS